MSEEKKVTIYVHTETFWQSILADCFMWLMIFSTIGIGVLLESDAMQWFGFLFAMITILFGNSIFQKKGHLKTQSFEKAKEFLDNKEKEWNS